MPETFDPTLDAVASAPQDLDPVSAATLAVMTRHAQNMASRDGQTIAADYAEDTVVFTSFSPEGPVLGRAGIAKWIDDNLANFEAALAGPDGAPPAMVRFTAEGEYGYLVVDLGGGRYGTETYHVRDDLILFESATFFL